MSRYGQLGVSMIEIMVGVAIIAILMGMGVPSFRDWIQSSQIRTAAEAVQNGLQLARTEAVRQNTSVQFVLDAGYGWTVGCVTATASCPATIQSRPGTEGSSNAVVAGVSLPATIVFNGLGRVTPAAATTFTVSNPTGGNCKTNGGAMRCLDVSISTGGQIRMCDPALASSDPRGC
jgi:type IV fimbrial biogenesis protein FimT